jgi:GxxExxY protein
MNDFTQQLRNEIERTSHNASNAPLATSERILYKELSYAIVGAAIEVHKHVGPGKLESCYEAALARELSLRDIPFRTQVPIPMNYKDADIGGFFADLIVDHKIVVELKAAEPRRVHKAQLLSYLHWTKLRLGLLINFDVPVLVHGVKRVVY